jgi:hypothetical protein
MSSRSFGTLSLGSERKGEERAAHPPPSPPHTHTHVHCVPLCPLVQAALAAAAAAGGGTVFFPRGTYFLTQPLVVPPRTVRALFPCRSHVLLLSA